MGGETENDRSSETKLEAKLVEAMKRRASAGTAMKSFNTVILKFPKIDENLRKCKAVFEQFDRDSNGAIDHQELKKCCQQLQVSFTEQEISFSSHASATKLKMSRNLF
ncbi:putative calcium-binding protein CML21 [Hibiscus syriacus]|uniref:Calcium-binding protein CML21 n=1 Tax=Hibiscus syriacus TaxID=106335 RepID=A0A6A3C9Z3_HIBSY|nr:putative calcium-binding protein CML21 [Hibiscus syriacus]